MDYSCKVRKSKPERNGRGKFTLHARLDYVERVDDQSRYDAGTKTSDGLDGGGRKARMAGVGHVRALLPYPRVRCSWREREGWIGR